MSEAASGPPAGDERPSRRRLVDRLRSLIRPRAAEADLREAIEELIEDSPATPAEFDARERELLRNILKLREITAYDVMIPRADIVAVPHDVTLADLVQKLAREWHSRMPVYRDTLDDVIGFVHIKDVIPFWGGIKEFRLDDIIRRVLFVAPSMRVLDLLLEMRKTRIHLALVVDEYGGIDGLVSIEDLVEEIVGEIEDEHDVDEGPRLVVEASGSFVVDARLPLGEFEEAAGPVLTSEEREADLDTVGGLAVSLAGRVPGRGEIVAHPAGFEFEVLDADPRRVKRLRVRRLAAPPPPATA
ncbi:MAG: HlyC/CorC family transporter [Alphaproteobacteria bacterium]|nr:HlyC/CorC family transporter [Alphaproteobacteria bacterium]